jgi:hydrophobic/amphiphilic exporter-1 (mainly G- bacteria), HAE1 family
MLKSLIDFAIERRVTIVMFTVAIALFGFVSLARLKLNLLPDLSYPTITIRTELPGAAPLELETLITRPVEESVSIIRNVREVRSVSRAGQSDVTLEFLWGTDMDIAGIDVREKLDLLQLPIEAKRPLLLRFDPASEPVMRIALMDEGAATGADSIERLKALRRFAEDRLKPDLEAVEGSAAVKVSGGYEDEVQVFVDQQKLAQLGLSIDVVTRRIRAENVNLSGGRLEQGTQRFLVRTLNEFESVEQMADAIIATRDGRPVYLRDVASVTRGYKDREAITRVNGRESIELAVYKEGDANTVALANGVRVRIKELEKSLPEGTRLQQVYDQSTFIAAAISEVKTSALIGGLLAILVLYAFLRDARATLISSIAIPVSVLGTFVLMYAFDITLNIMSLGGIALAVGMLVDNAVVVLESIVRNHEKGMTRVEAARRGTAEVATAVFAATLTSVAVFAPMIFITGIAGQLFKDQSLTVAFALSFSLLVALTLVPMLAAGRRRTEGPGARWPWTARRARWLRTRRRLDLERLQARAEPARQRDAGRQPLGRPQVPGRHHVGAGAPGQGDRLGRRGVRADDGADPAAARHGTDPADVAGRIQRRPAPAAGYAARADRPRGRGCPARQRFTRQRRPGLQRRGHGQPTRRQPGRRRREHRPAEHHVAGRCGP